MSTTVTYPGGPTMPVDLALRGTADETSRSRTVVHQPLDGAAVYTLRPGTAPSGSLRLFFHSEQAARDCASAHRVTALFTIATTDFVGGNFSYIVNGAVRLEQSDAIIPWVVYVDYQQVGS